MTLISYKYLCNYVMNTNNLDADFISNNIDKSFELIHNESDDHKDILDRIYSVYDLLDLYVFISYVMENYNKSYILYKILFHYIDSHQLLNKKVNISNLHKINENILNYNTKYYRMITKIEDTKSQYKYTFLYYINDTYITIQNCKKKYGYYIYDIQKLHTKIYEDNYKIIHYENNCTFTENISDTFRLLSDLVYIDDDYLYENYINNLKEDDLSIIIKLNILCMWCKCIYKDNLIIFEDTFDDYYIIKHNGNIIDYNLYISDIIIYLNKINICVSKFFESTITEFMNEIYIKNTIKKPIECSITFDMIENNNDITYCTSCNNYFSYHTFVKLFRGDEEYKQCPFCRKSINSYMIYNIEHKYNLFNKILSKLIE